VQPTPKATDVFTKTTILLIALAAGVALFLFRSASTISAAQARSLVEAGATLVDVRTPAEYGGGHIDGALNIPIDQLAARIGELGDKSAPIVLYCRSGARSGRGMRLLQAEGFEQVLNLGAMSRWE
jgi:rhodanese-related sulfurtransferase